jgi:hypothetical protein
MHQQLWGYKVDEKLYVGVREQKRLNTADLAGRLHKHEQPYRLTGRRTYNASCKICDTVHHSPNPKAHCPGSTFSGFVCFPFQE